MLRSMYAGVSGLKGHQQQMDVIGNNISNVNTTGFKGSRVTFKEMLSQTINGASSPQGGRGGTNPKQVGLGVQLGSIDKNMGQGSLQSTGKETDIALQGNGFFIVNDGNQNLYTRAGNTSFDEEGYLVNSASGNRVQGWVANENGTIKEANMDSLEDISLDETMDASATTEASYGDNLNPTLEELNLTEGSDTLNIHDGDPNNNDKINISLSKGENENEWNFSLNADSNDTDFEDADGDNVGNSLNGTITLDASGIISKFEDADEDEFAGSINVSDIDGTGNGTEITLPDTGDHINTTSLFTGLNSGDTSEAITNNEQTISTSVYDSQGAEHNVTFDILKNGENRWLIAEDSFDVSGASPTDGSWLGGSDHQIEFDENGKLTSGQNATLQMTPNGGADEQEIALDFSQFTQYEGDMTADLDQADGYTQGELKDFTINDSGTIVGSFDNGYNKTLAQIGVAEFANPEGLNKSGETMFTVSNNSGYPKVGAAGSGKKGFISSSKLEMSNVDLAEQFTKMITSQRGFQANSKVITTSDEMLQGLVNIIR